MTLCYPLELMFASYFGTLLRIESISLLWGGGSSVSVKVDLWMFTEFFSHPPSPFTDFPPKEVPQKGKVVFYCPPIKYTGCFYWFGPKNAKHPKVNLRAKLGPRGGICQCRHRRLHCKIFASGVSFSIFTHFLWFFLLKLLKLGGIDGVKFWSNSMSECGALC